MTNKAIANAFDELANLLELLEENEFKIRSYRNAYLTLRKLDVQLAELSDAEIQSIKGIGPAISSKIRELIHSGTLKALEEARNQMPPGVAEMLLVNGFGPKKVRAVWRDMGIESIGELWYACNENRLVEYKGFGLKTQEDLKSRLEYFLKSKDKFHIDTAEQEADFAGAWLTGKLPGAFVSPVGEVRRANPVVNTIEMLVAFNGDITHAFDGQTMTLEKEESGVFHVRLENNTRLTIHKCLLEEFGSKLFQLTGSRPFIEAFIKKNQGLSFKSLRTEEEVFQKAKIPFLPPEIREQPESLTQYTLDNPPNLIREQDLKGVLHVHTTWSDGQHSLRDMCLQARDLGYAYIGITDHSQSAFYANGLKPERILAQMEEIDALNAELHPFLVLKGIESDILHDGSLDYPDAILEKFDFLIASVHSNLKMDRDKATARILKAIQNPFTTILGHPTGRLLLSREGYPLDWERVLDACAEHKVAIELNANPYRLDIDYTLIPEATRRNIRIGINPDAHSKQGLLDVRYGVMAARKGGLSPEQCLNALPVADWLPKNKI